MSHGPVAEGSSAEPNLTPLLDVVLQLLMFFMMCVNFVNEQVNEEITLPRSEQAKPMDKGETDALFLNLRPFSTKEFEKRFAKAMPRLLQNFKDGDACVLVPGQDPMNMDELQIYLRRQYQDAEKLAKDRRSRGEGDGKVHTSVIIRADAKTDYGYVYETFKRCKEERFEHLKLRATTKNKRV